MPQFKGKVTNTMLNSPFLQIIVLAAVAIFLILRLRDVLGTRTGFEPESETDTTSPSRPNLQVVADGPDRDIIDHVDADSPAADAFRSMKAKENTFSVSEFISGGRGAYEMILMAFEQGDIEEIRAFVSPDIYDAFQGVVASREDDGLTIEAEFIGVAEALIRNATFDPDTREAEIEMAFVGEMTSVVRDRAGDVVEGSTSEIKKQKDIWTFSRVFGSDDPNWVLVETGG